MEKYNICILIPARYHSSRLLGKPLLKINNKTIIQLTYQQVLKSKYVNENNIFVVTDDDRIIKSINEINGKCIKILENCLNGTERICYALNNIDKKYNIIVNCQGDEPFINPENIDFSIEKYIENINVENHVCTTLHTKILNYDDLFNRNIGKIIIDKYNNILYCSRSMIPFSKKGKPLPNINYYSHIGIFIFNRKYLDNNYLNDYNSEIQISEDIEWLNIIYHGYKIKSYLVENSEIGINTIDDYEYLYKKYINTIDDYEYLYKKYINTIDNY
jgi:3-deoxy-manno-octulosonate cytidylyltransferase (CMP-KDO synthetase)